VDRYQGESLPRGSHVALLANDAIGNFVVSTPLLQAIRRQHPQCHIHYVSGPRVTEFLAKSDLMDSYEFLGARSDASQRGRADTAPSSFDLTINLERSPEAMRRAAELAASGLVAGPCMGADGSPFPQPDDERGRLWEDGAWTAPDLMHRYPILRSPFIGEIFCRLAYWDGEIPPYRIPVEDPVSPVPDMLIACSASLEEKLWTVEGWLAAVAWAQGRGLAVGLVGAPPSAQRERWKGAAIEDELVARSAVHDLRGTWTLPQVAGALSRCRLVLTLDNGILHIAAAVGTSIVGLYRPEIHRLWAPPSANLRAVWPAVPQATVATIGVDDVIGELELSLAAAGSLA